MRTAAIDAKAHTAKLCSGVGPPLKWTQRNTQKGPAVRYQQPVCHAMGSDAGDALLSVSRIQWPAVAAAAALGTAAPWLIDGAKRALRPRRCTQCQGATTVLCQRCGARGKCGGVLEGNPLRRCEVCGGAGRVTCSKCRGAGMENSWLWRTSLEVPKPAESDSASGDTVDSPLFK